MATKIWTATYIDASESVDLMVSNRLDTIGPDGATVEGQEQVMLAVELARPAVRGLDNLIELAELLLKAALGIGTSLKRPADGRVVVPVESMPPEVQAVIERMLGLAPGSLGGGK